MKNFAKFMVVAVAVTIFASMFILGISAAVETPALPNPAELKPGSDRVVFIKDAPRDENFQYTGESLEGDGTGSDANNPLIPMDSHERFDPGAERKRYHLLTALYQANEMLAETGGTIVICGPVFIGINEVGDNGATSVRDNETVVFKDNVIKYTSVWDGVDYRETADAKLILQLPAMLLIRGSTIWENIDLVTDGTDRAICFSDYCTYVGKGVNCYPLDSAFEGVAQNYISLVAGHRFSAAKDKTSNLLVQSGTYNKIIGSTYGTANYLSENYVSNVTLEGSTKVLGLISGSINAKHMFGGHTNITINDGTYECDINGVGVSGFQNTDGTVNIKINGGDFRNCWSINESAMGFSNNPPAFSTLDFSGWKGDLVDLAFANLVVTDFTEIKYPDGVTAEQLSQMELPEVVPETEPAEDDEKDTQPADTKPADTKPADTKPAEVTEKEDETEITPTGPKDDNNSKGISPIIYVVIGVIAVAIIAVVVVLLLKKKK